MLKDELFGNDVKLSYSRLNLLKCPVKYYVTKFIGIQTFSIHILIGLVVHKIYEDLLTGKLNIEQAKNDSTIKEYIEDFSKLYQSDLHIPDIHTLISEIKQHIWNDLGKYVEIFLSKGYELKVESEHIITKTNIQLFEIEDVYIRPDLYLQNESEIKLIDIKTSRKYRSEYKSQLVFYLKMLADTHKNIQKFEGIIYLSRYGEIKKAVTCNRTKLDTMFKHILSPIKQLYHKLQISDFKSIKDFVKSISNMNESQLFKLRCELFSQFGNVCGFCPIKKICPIYNLKPSIEFTNLIKGETKEDLIVVTSSFGNESVDLIGFVES